MSKLIIASNRLPLTMKRHVNGFDLAMSHGGLVTGLSKLLREESTLWVGWHGCSDDLSVEERDSLETSLREMRFAAVDLSAQEIEHYYNGVSNAIFWPVYHYLIDKIELDLTGWDHYLSANRKFAEKILSCYEPGDFIWIHDYHLQLVPEMLRREIPDAKIGFFLHIPFPAPDVFRILPWRDDILKGLLGADIIGFHTSSYCMNFQAALLRVLGVETLANSLLFDGRTVKLGSFPLGVDIDRLNTVREESDEDKIKEITSSIHALKLKTFDGEGPKTAAIFLAIDRMDYTKGIPQRLLSFERLLENYPNLQGRTILMQIAAPSRDTVPAYERYREIVDGLVGRINGKFGLPGYQPIHYISRNYSQGELIELYRLVDVMLVTPLRDGMNLVAKEFIASRLDDDGVLILSEFAGAAEELGEALLVNPYDLNDCSNGMLQAILMSEDERTTRMKSLRQRVTQFDASTWARRFMDFLHTSESSNAVPFLSPQQLLDRIPHAERITLFLDYDGTLFPIVRIPRLAKPDAALMNLLSHLSRYDKLDIHIVSGRPRETLEQWFPLSRIHLHAEHGAMSREAGSDQWVDSPSHLDRAQWMPFVRTTFEDFCRNTPGSFIEEKAYSIVWHYRMSEPLLADNMSKILRAHSRESFSPMGLEIVPAKKALEVRPKGINKGTIVKRICHQNADQSFPIAIGDDVTDEDMFQAMQDNGLSVVVGDHMSTAAHRLRSPTEVRLFLECLAQTLHQNI